MGVFTHRPAHPQTLFLLTQQKCRCATKAGKQLLVKVNKMIRIITKRVYAYLWRITFTGKSHILFKGVYIKKTKLPNLTGEGGEVGIILILNTEANRKPFPAKHLLIWTHINISLH